MASATNLPLKTISLTTVVALGVIAARVNIQKLLVSTLTGPGSTSRIVAAVIVLTNLKNVPFAWHFRVFNAIFKHCIFSKPKIPASLGPTSLFAPIITSSHSPLWECDYNLHKSNSTYFSDLDPSRSHLVCCLFQPGIEKLHHNAKEKLVVNAEGMPHLGRWNIMLGSVMCSFKREIGIYEGFEMWSRVLCWDRKWLYIVTHFVKKGTVKPSAYILTDGSWFGGKGYQSVKRKDRKEGEADVDEKAIFASAISKYVVKLGRFTVHPEVLLNASGVLPERPGGWATMSGVSGDSTPEIIESANESPSNGEWDWKMVEAEKEKGMRYVEAFAALDGLHQEFSGSKAPALGKYRDFLV